MDGKKKIRYKYLSCEITEIKYKETLRENHKYENLLLVFLNVVQYVARYSNGRRSIAGRVAIT